MSGLIILYCYNYTDENRAKLKEFKTGKALESYLKKQNIVDKFATFADKNGLKRRNLMIQKSYKLLERFLNSRVIYNILDEQAWTEYLNQDDPAVIKTLQLFRDGKAFPQPEKEEEQKKVAMAFDYRSTHIRSTLIANA